MTETTDVITVMIRIRPLSEKERFEDAKTFLKADEKNGNTIAIENAYKIDTKYFTFDHVCYENAPQSQVFELIGIPIANACLDGYNGCIFAYGQTGAGKTYTIQGNGLDTNVDIDKRGILPRVFEYIFAKIYNDDDKSNNPDYLIKCSYLEIYNEHIQDLVIILIFTKINYMIAHDWEW